MSMSGTGQDLYNLKIPVAQLRAALLGGNIKNKPQIAALTPVATANATDAATVITLANASKVAINAIITALKA